MRAMGNPDWASSIRRTFCSALCLAIYNHSKAIISCGHLCVVYTLCGENPLPQKDFAEKLYCLAPCSCGNCFLSLRGSAEIQIGDFITLGFALLFSAQIVIVGNLPEKCETIPITFYQTLASAVFAGIAAFCTGIPNELFSIHSWTGIVYLGVINTAVALGLQNFAQKYTSESHAALLLSLESVFGLLFSILYYGDILTLRMAIGCALIFAALLVSNRR